MNKYQTSTKVYKNLTNWSFKNYKIPFYYLQQLNYILQRFLIKREKNLGCPTKHDSSKTTWRSCLIVEITCNISSFP